MKMNKQSDKNIKDIFEKMDYGSSEEQMTELEVWLQSTFFPTLGEDSVELISLIDNKKLCMLSIPEHVEVIVDNIPKADDLDKHKRSTLLEKLALEIVANANLLSQIEAATRGILVKETKLKVIPVLKEYFLYYSTLPLQYSIDDTKTVVGVISNESSLLSVGLFIAPALASGCRIIIQAGRKVFLAIHLIKELAAKVGFNSITVIPSDDNHLHTYIGSSVELSAIVLFVDLLSKKYLALPEEISNTRILYLSNYRIPAIVFDDADLDSVCEGILEASWSKWAMCSVGTVFVQESIFEEFMGKLKARLQSLRIGKSNDKLADISSSSGDFVNLKKTMDMPQDIEIFQAAENRNEWQPTLLIGGNVDTGRAFSSDEDNGQILTVLAFRSIEEAVNLANNSKQGLAASVWSENLCLINEVSRNLKVSTVWVNNTFGSNAPNVAFSPLKESGLGYFGGVEGFFEILSPYDPFIIKREDRLDKHVCTIINTVKKAQNKWMKLPKIKRIITLLPKLKDVVDSHFSSYAEDYWSIICKYLHCKDKSGASTQCGYDLTSYQEPRGVIAVGNIQDRHAVYITIRALLEGNTVVCQHWIAKDLGPHLPDDVLKYVPDTDSASLTIKSHNDIQVYYGAWNADILPPLQSTDVRNFQWILEDEFYNKVSVIKNIWCDIGKSYSCNFGD